MRFTFTRDRKLPVVQFAGKGAATAAPGVLVIPCTAEDLRSPLERIRFMRGIVRAAKRFELSGFTLPLRDLPTAFGNEDPHAIGRLLGEQFLLANYEYNRYKSKRPAKDAPLKAVAFAGAKPGFEKGIRDGRAVAEEINWARDLANAPANEQSPAEFFALVKKHLEKIAPKDIRVRDIAEHDDARRMGLFRGVAQGSDADHLPAFVVAEYGGAHDGLKDPIIFIGKGVVYDTGGLSLKISGAMLGMHLDMSGGAAAAAGVALAARLKLPKNVVALIPVVENAVGNRAQRPGDIRTAYNGATVEVTNTDAEGRLILADALAYAAEKYPKATALSIATLTGSAVRSLGHYASALFSKNDALAERLFALAEPSGNRVWRMPLFDDYLERIKSVRADLTNIDKDDAKEADASIAAAFLGEFAGSLAWAHLDMAPRDVSIPADNLAAGASGEPVSLLARFLEGA